jgi:hypothetical protein
VGVQAEDFSRFFLIVSNATFPLDAFSNFASLVYQTQVKITIKLENILQKKTKKKNNTLQA